MTTRRGAGRPPRISRDEIVAVAKRIVEDEGVERLTMRRLAKDVGATPMALYHHVPDKDGLLVLLMEDVAATLPRPRLSADPTRRVLALFQALHGGTFQRNERIDDLRAVDAADQADVGTNAAHEPVPEARELPHSAKVRVSLVIVVGWQRT